MCWHVYVLACICACMCDVYTCYLSFDRLARNEELIASLMDDLKFECESFLMQANDIK